jgi:phospholipid N-methyltransferase
MNTEEVTSQKWMTGGAYTHQEHVYMSHLDNHPHIVSLLRNGSVLEIGPGTGKYAEMLINKFNPRQYTILDLAKNIGDSMERLSGHKSTELSFVHAENYVDLFGLNFDVLVSNVVIPETPKKYRENLLTNVIPRCKASMIICQIKEEDSEGNEPMELFFSELYNKVYNKVIFEQTSYRNCYCMIGYNE